MRGVASLLASEYALHLALWLWQSTLVALLALAIVRLLPRSSPRFRSSVLGLALWKMFLPPMLPLPTGAFSQLGPSGDGAFRSLSGLGLTAIMALAVVHAAGAAWRLVLVWRARCRLQRPFARVRRRGRIQVAVEKPEDSLGTPVACGFWRPTIVFPETVAKHASRIQRRMVFAHERQHLERCHGLLLVVEEILAALGWVQPLFGTVVAAHRRVSEELCDLGAVARLRIEPALYASSLLEVAALCGGGRAPVAALPAAESVAGLATRIAALGRRARWSTAEAVAAIVLWAVLLPGIRPWPAAHPAARHPAAPITLSR